MLPAAFPNLLANGAQGIAVGMATSIPPHNIAELCDAALYLIEQPNARSRTLLKFVPGPDFPTGGIIVDPPETIAEAYTTGRGSFRLRARWKTEDTGRGTYQVVVTEIPWQVQKMRLVEQIAELINEKKLPLVADMHDEFGRRRAPRVRAALAHRRSGADDGEPVQAHRAGKPRAAQHERAGARPHPARGRARRGAERMAHPSPRSAAAPLALSARRRSSTGSKFWAAIWSPISTSTRSSKIIRNEDEPKPVLMKTFKLSDVQADAILNMRLRNLRRLEEIEIRDEDKTLRAEKKSIEDLLRSEKAQWKTIAGQIREVREQFGPKTPLGKRRTGFAQAPAHDEAAIEEALVEREPVTVVVSEKGWIRALRGQVADLSSLAFKTDDALDHAFFAETTSKILVFATNGTLLHDRCGETAGRTRPRRADPAVHRPRAAGGRSSIVFRYQGGRKLLVASKQGRGFIVAEDECLANTRKGKQVLNVKPPDAARAIAPVDGELVAAIGDNRKMVVFPIEQVPEMTRGRGVRLQRHKDGGLSDIKIFEVEKGLTWTDSAGRVFTLSLKELSDWRGNRADAGRLAPKGFPKNNKFGGKAGLTAANGKGAEE